MSISAPQILAAGAVVVVLSAAAGFVGGSLAEAPPAPEAPVPVAAVPNDLLDRFDELSRRVDRVGNEARAATDYAKLAIERLDELEERMSAGVPVAPTGTDDASLPRLTPEEIAKIEWADTQNYAEKATQEFRKRFKHHIKFVLRLYGDATPKGAADRLAQAQSEGQRFAVQYSLEGSVADTAIAAFRNHFESAAREVGPFLREGLERADVTRVRENLDSVWREDDRRIRTVLNDEQWEEYEAQTKGMRKLWTDLLEEQRE